MYMTLYLQVPIAHHFTTCLHEFWQAFAQVIHIYVCADIRGFKILLK